MPRANGSAEVDGTAAGSPGGQAASVPMTAAACAKETTPASRETSPGVADLTPVPDEDVDTVSMHTDPSSQTDEDVAEANTQLEPSAAAVSSDVLQFRADTCNNFYDLPEKNENVPARLMYCCDPRCRHAHNEESRSNSNTLLTADVLSSPGTANIVTAYCSSNRNMVSPEPPSGSEESLLPRSEPQSPAPWPSQLNLREYPVENMYHDALLMRPSVPRLMDIDLIRFGPNEYDDEDDSENGGLLPRNRVCSAVNSASYQCGHGQNVPEYGNMTTEGLPMCAQRCFTLTAATTQAADEETEAYDVCEAYDLFLDVYLPKRVGLPQVKSAAEISVASSVSQKSLPICRICHLPANDDDHLISPCRCAGTMQFIHSSCLMKWLEISNKRSKHPPSCELCLYQYHRHKKFKVNHWQFPPCSNRDKVLHVIFVVSLLTMIGCASATIMCFKHDKGMRSGLDKTELTRSEVVTLVCGVLFFIAFFVAMYVEVKSRNTIYKLLVTFVYLNQQWYIDEYDKKKDLQPVPV